MSKPLTLLFVSAALSAAIGLPAWSAMQDGAAGETVRELSTLFSSGDAQHPLILADNDSQENEGGTITRNQSDDDEDECEDDDGNCGASATQAPAPAGTVPPPQNGLFDNTTPPKAQVK